MSATRKQHSVVSCLVALAIGWLIASWPQSGFAAPPRLGAVVPGAVMPGQTTTLTLHGQHLEHPTALWTSFTASAELAPDIQDNGRQSNRVVYRLTLPETSTVGIVGLRIATATGVSNLRPIMIDDLPSIADNGQNKSLDTAQAVTLPVAIDGVCDPESADLYAIDATVGQRLTVEVVARRLGWALDPVIRLLDASGRELAYNDDAPGIGPDARLRHVFQAPGRYFIEIRDVRYRGGGSYRYRLRLGDFPLLSGAFPLGGLPGSQIHVEAVSLAPNDPPIYRQITVPADWSRPRLPLAFAWRPTAGSAFLDFAVRRTPPIVELEPNDSAQSASPIALPATIHGRFQQAGDRDCYRFEAKKGQVWQVRGIARSFGSPADLVLKLQKADGTTLAETDDDGKREGMLIATIPEDGSYRLIVDELLHRGGPGLVYCIDIRRHTPGFELEAQSDTLNLPQGGVAVLTVRAIRRGYNGPIHLSVEGPPKGLRLAEQVIAEKKNETTLRLTAPAAWKPGQWWPIRIVGKATIQDQPLVVVANTESALRRQFNQCPFPPATLNGQMALGVGPRFPDFFQLAAAQPVITWPQLADQTRFKIKAQRSHGFDGAIRIAIENLPQGVTAEAKPIAKGQSETEVVLRGPVALAQGTYPIRIVGQATHQHQPRRMVLDDLTLQVVSPLAFQAQPCQVAPGSRQTLAVRVERRIDDRSEIRITWPNPPAGIRLVDPAIIAADADQAELQIEVSPAVSPGSHKGLQLVAQTTMKGRRIVAQSEPFSIEIVPPATANR